MRMMLLLNRILWAGVGRSIFVTLTYPDIVAKSTSRERSQHRYLFFRYVEKSLKRKVPIIWKVEFMTRKSGALMGQVVPHIHMGILGCEYLHHQEVNDWWRGILGVEGKIVTDVRRITEGEGMGRYLGKYVSKHGSLDIGAYRNTHQLTGRHWGVTRKDLIPMAEKTTWEVSSAGELQAIVEVGEALRPGYVGPEGSSYTLLGRVAKDYLLERLGKKG